jgi:mRNA interferase MazF
MNVNIKNFKYEKMRKEQIKEFKNLLFQAIGTNTVSMFCEENKIDYLLLDDFLNMKSNKISMRTLKIIAHNIDNENYDVTLQKVLNSIGMRLQLWYADLGDDCRGHEQRGIRPIIVIGSQEGTILSGVVTVAMITGAEHNKSIMSTHVVLDTYCGLKKKSMVELEQTRTLDKSRLLSYVGTINRGEDIVKINKAINIANGTYNPLFDEVSEIIKTAEIQQNNSIINDILNFKSITKSFLSLCREKVFMEA